MTEAVIMLERSTDEGKNADTIQFQTMRKLRSMFNNEWQVSARGQSPMVMAKEKNKLTVSESRTHCKFFERFVRGAHKRMGDIVKPDWR